MNYLQKRNNCERKVSTTLQLVSHGGGGELTSKILGATIKSQSCFKAFVMNDLATIIPI